MNDTLLSVQNLKTHFRTPEGLARAVDRISFDIKPNDIFALVGESGCGKDVYPEESQFTQTHSCHCYLIPRGILKIQSVFTRAGVMKIPKSSFKTLRERRLAGNLQERRTQQPRSDR